MKWFCALTLLAVICGCSGPGVQSQRSLGNSASTAKAEDFGAERPTALNVSAFHSYGIRQIVFNDDGSLYATLDQGGIVKVWKSNLAFELRTLPASTRATAIAFSPENQLLLGSSLGKVQIYDLDGKLTAEFPKETAERIVDLGTTAGGKYLVVAHEHYTEVFDRAHGYSLINERDRDSERTITNSGSIVSQLAFSPKGDAFAASLRNAASVRLAPWTSRAQHETPIMGIDAEGNAFDYNAHGNPLRPLPRSRGSDGIDSLFKYSLASVYALAFDPQGDEILSASDDFSVKAWSIRSKSFRLKIPTAGPVVDAVYSPDGSKIAYAEAVDGISDICVRVLDRQTGRQVFELPKRTSYSHDGILAFTPDGNTLIVAGQEVAAWDLKRRRPAFTLRSGASLTAARLSPDGSILVTGDALGRIRQWDTATSKDRLAEIESTNGCGFLVLSGGSLLLYDPTDASKFRSTQDGSLYSIPLKGPVKSIGTGGSLLLLYGKNGQFSLFDPNLKRVLFTRRLPHGPDLFDGASPPPTLTMRSTFIPYEVPRVTKEGINFGLEVRRGHLSISPMQYYDFLVARHCPQKHILAIWTLSGGIIFFDSRSGKVLRQLPQMRALEPGMRFSSDGRFLVTWYSRLNSSSCLKIWSLPQMRNIRTEKYGKPISSVAIGGHTVAVATGDRLNIISLDAPYASRSIHAEDQVRMPSTGGIPLPTNAAAPSGNLKISAVMSDFAVAVAPDGKQVAALDLEGTFMLVDTGTGRSKYRFKGAGVRFRVDFPQEWPQYICYSQDGRSLFCGSTEGTIFEYRTSDAALIRAFEGGRGPTRPVAVGTDFLGSFGADDSLRIWSLKTGALLCTNRFIDDRSWICYTPDGRFDGSPDALSRARFVLGVQTAPVRSLFKELYTPGLFQTSVSQSPQNRLREVDAVSRKLTGRPKIEVKSWIRDRIEGASFAQIKALLRPVGRPVSALVGFVNGKVVYRAAFSGRVGKTEEVTLSLPLGWSRNVMELFAIDDQGTWSEPTTIESLESGVQPTSRLFVLTVGYSGPGGGYAESDATTLANALELGGQTYSQVISRSLVGPDASKGKVVKAITNILKEARSEDALIVFFAGHGGEDTNDIGAVFEAAPSADGLAAKIRSEDLLAWVRDLQPQRQLWIFDSCYSGKMTAPIKAYSQTLKFQTLQFNTGIDLLVSTGAASNQVSYEFSTSKSGVLTAAILKALSAAPNPISKSIPVRDFLRRATENVDELNLRFPAHARQRAQFFQSPSRSYLEFPVPTTKKRIGQAAVPNY